MMIRKMFRKLLVPAGLLAATLMTSCGTSSSGSKHQTMNGVSESGYPAGKPRDAESPALSSSSEQANSKPGPKVPVEAPARP